MTIQQFTHQIELIQNNITKIFNKNPLDEQLQVSASRMSLVGLIQQKLYKKQYALAMQLSHSQQKQKLQQGEKLYLPYLRIQILQNLQGELITKKIHSQFIVQTISSLNIYIKNLQESQIQEIINNSTKLQEGTLLYLISHALLQKKQKGLDQDDILEVIFKCKLFSLNRQQKGVKEEDKISKFFYDIYQLISLKGRSSHQINRLASIFCQNIALIQTHLSETFIVSGQGQVVSFRYDLYQQLLSTQSFLQILDSLHSIIAQNYRQAPKLSLRQSFLNLWNNYYEYLLQLLLIRCNPISKLPKQQPKDSQTPKQLQKYFKVSISVDTILNTYKQQLKILIKNLQQLLDKTQQLCKKTKNSNETMKQIKQFYRCRIKQINQQIQQYLIQLSQNASVNNLNYVILLFFLCDQFNHIFDQEHNSHHLKDIGLEKLVYQFDFVQKFCLVFQKEFKQQWNIQFDYFFMNFNPTTLCHSKMVILRKVILWILEGVMKSKDAERANALITQTRIKREKQEKQKEEKKSRLPDMPSELKGTAIFTKKR